LIGATAREGADEVHRWDGLGAVPADWGRSVVTVGVFDGVHRGHRMVVGRAVARGRDLGLPVVAVTFDPHPMQVLRPDSAPRLLTGIDQRVRLLGESGIDAVLVIPFTRDFFHLEPEQFVEQVLVGRLHTAAVVVGADFRFGYRAAGDVTTLTELGARFGFTVEGLAIVGDPDDRFSSTRTRGHVQAGEVEEAARVLGRPPHVEGVVVKGDDRGWALGFPTANLACPPEMAIPGDGVYAGWLVVDSDRLPAAISVGTNPTFDGVERRVEAYAIDRDDLELYGREVSVEFVARLRGMERFDSVAALRAQMAEDVAQARDLLEAAAAPSPDRYSSPDPS
jgi:riboflavin kinase/FMN adenylyltransferase